MKFETAVFAGGCFWCTEAIFRRLKGVESVESGYVGGKVENPSYEEVSSGKTGHAEAVRVKFDPKIIGYEKLLDIFWTTHDPTTLNRQGPDVGKQYRSVIFYINENQKKEAEESKARHNEKGRIVTTIEPLDKFYKAEEYHQDYFERNKQNPYCSIIIVPKIEKLIEKFNDEVKDNYKKEYLVY